MFVLSSLLPFRAMRFALLMTLLLFLCPAQAHSPRKPQAILCIDRLPTPEEVARRDTRGKYEPAAGCYLGAFIDFDPTLKMRRLDQNRTEHQDPAGFEQIVHKPHSMYFFYVGYGHPMPLDWVRFLAGRGKFVHIALEPNDGLAKVKDDAYLRKMADSLGQTKAKIFLRFGSEMNGSWTNYHNPTLFKEKFRLVHDVMKQRAPNVAMVWCPYTFPKENIPDYYPGDDATDWVGVNMYSVTYHNNSLASPCEYEHPYDLLSHVYDRYAARKPFMICEFAATHFADCEGRPRPDFALRKMVTLYSALPRLFPRVKAINYFDSNNIQFTDHAKNDYSVTNDPTVLAAYRYSIAPSYFLPAPLPDGQKPPPTPIPMPMRKGELLRGKVQISCVARAPSDILSVRYKVDGILIYKGDRPDLWPCSWEAGSVAPGRHNLTLEVLNSQGKVVASQTLSIITRR